MMETFKWIDWGLVSERVDGGGGEWKARDGQTQVYGCSPYQGPNATIKNQLVNLYEMHSK
jgi:hypothetical protein